MSKEKFAELLKDDRSGGAATPPGPSLAQVLKEAGGAIWDANKEIFGHGSAELASALFRGDAHVMYGWGGTGPEQEPVQAPQTPEATKAEPEPDRGMER